jgi:hypothetical protein
MGIILVFFLLLNLPAFLMVLVGLAIRKSNPKPSKILFILSGIYLLVGIGLCGLFLNSGF